MNGYFQCYRVPGSKVFFYSWAFDHIRTLGLKAQAPNQFDNSSGQSIFMNKQFATADSY